MPQNNINSEVTEKIEADAIESQTTLKYGKFEDLPPHSGAWGLPLIHHVSDTMERKIMEWQTLYFYVHDYIHSWKNCYANYKIDPNRNSSLILYEEDKFYTIKFCHKGAVIIYQDTTIFSLFLTHRNFITVPSLACMALINQTHLR